VQQSFATLNGLVDAILELPKVLIGLLPENCSGQPR
jgi:hypothetical protein